MDLVFKKLRSDRTEDESLLASCAQLIAELAKTGLEKHKHECILIVFFQV